MLYVSLPPILRAWSRLDGCGYGGRMRNLRTTELCTCIQSSSLSEQCTRRSELCSSAPTAACNPFAPIIFSFSLEHKLSSNQFW
ncbi:hypothetical protein QL285_032345 [Trifolium repens]|nr:hypothetical protein QL285_032345 [Trifolium repens]